ncbi:MAG: nicotinamide-nucleotide adenylyltransferase [Nitrosopumilaceae archaeon]|nr:nicotinamide-nucleotide adenylyltransferase [Nitrosopumilaceae archaeon]
MNGLLIGRFQPFHLGHLDALKFALSKTENLWVGLGSSNLPKSKDNPFSAEERKKMILDSIDDSISSRIEIFFIPDMDNHIKWIEMIDTIVPNFEIIFTNDPLTEKLYSKRGIKAVSIPFTNREILSGTNIRNMIVNDQNWQNLVPEGTRKFLESINAKDRLKIL